MTRRHCFIPGLLLCILVILFCSSCLNYVDPPKDSPTVIPTYFIDGFCSQIDGDGNLSFSWSYTDDGFERLSVTVSATYAESSQNHVVVSQQIDDVSVTELSYAGEPGIVYSYTFAPYGNGGKAGKVFSGTSYAVPAGYEARLPRLVITTKDGELPDCDYVTHPEGSMGWGITNNDYVKMDVSIVAPDDEVLYTSGTDMGSKLKLRGNTSAYGAKKPYKIKLGKKADLLSYITGRTGNQYKDKEWLLLATGTRINNVIGFATNEYMGIEFTPEYAYVEVFINGDYRGVYLLVENVKQGNTSGSEQARCAVDDDGFIVEHDAYWWNEGVFVRTDRLHKNFTFKYPDEDDVTGAQMDYIKNCLDAFEEALFRSDDSYADVIDVDSFVAWVMVHEYLGCHDAAGSNQFIMKRDSTPDTRLEMTTTWDFDGIMHEDDRGRRAHMNRSSFFYASKLLAMPSFLDACKSKYAETRDGIIAAVCGRIDALDAGAIDAAGAWDDARWLSGHASVSSQRAGIVSWLNERLVWMDRTYGALARRDIEQ